MVKSPSLKGYFFDQPCAPNLMRPEMRAWKKHKANSVALNSLGFKQLSMLSCENLEYARFKFDFKSVGASSDTLMHRCRIGSGMRSQRRPCMRPGGSDVRKQRNSSWENSSTTSNARSNCFSHACIKWMFCNMTHPPSFADFVSALSATCSCPCPMEMLTKRPLASVMPNFRPKASMVGVGSTPGKRTKKNGVMHVDSWYDASMSNGGCSMYSGPKLSVMNWERAAPMRSGRSTRSKNMRWKGPRSRTLRGRSAISAFSSVNHRFQPSESCSMLSSSFPHFLKASTPSRVRICAHCVSLSQVFARSGRGGGAGSGGARIRIICSSGETLPDRTRIFSSIMDTTVSLSLSSSPRRV
mmetsp:Transcript_74281/g.227247  ORF Transcript_74281/g.227247 Transcript_74281/m.227247 type:complete len:355 (-) Transcript_74281:458-1522(-)